MTVLNFMCIIYKDMTFEELGLRPELIAKLSAKKIVEPTTIQQEAFEPIVNEKALVGLSKTGTGKTLAYVLPLLQRATVFEQSVKGVHTLVLIPTRELAVQVSTDLSYLSGRSDYAAVIVGGEAEEPQQRAAQTAKWIISTPGRLLDLLRRRLVSLSEVKVVVFDEADRLLDMGFVDDMREIMRLIGASKPQMLFFSATAHFGVDEMAYEFGAQDLLRIGKEEPEMTVEGLDHRVAFVGEDEKFHALAHILKTHGTDRGVVFSNFRHKAHDLARRLHGLGCQAEVLTAQLNQRQRVQIMEQFREGKVRVLVASDLAARGLDVFDIDFVVNYELPEDPSTYVHRVGRTARAGRKGFAISFVGFEDSFRMERLEKFLGISIPRQAFEGAELSGSLPRFSEVEKPQRPVYQAAPQREAVAPREFDRGTYVPRPKVKLSVWQKWIAKLKGIFAGKGNPVKNVRPNPEKLSPSAKKSGSSKERRHDNRGGRNKGSAGQNKSGQRNSRPRGSGRP